MWEFDCGVVLVVGDDGRLAGVVTDRDICLAAYMHRKSLHLIPLAKTMVKQVISVHAEDDVRSAEHLMRDNRIRRLPVIDDGGHPVGVISVDDLVQWAARDTRTPVDHEFVDTLATVLAPRSREAGLPHPLVPLWKTEVRSQKLEVSQK
jgi:signal-transduction protein with cAMP-binding, CBS, and nucleotidyltransferase domain